MCAAGRPHGSVALAHSAVCCNSFLHTPPQAPQKLRGFSDIQKHTVEPSHSAWPAVLFYALSIYAALLVLPDYFQIVMPGLDASWGFALNHFVHTSYKFGPDLVFTYGPLGFIAVPEHISWNLPVALMIRFAVWAVLLAQLIAMWKGGQRFAALALVASIILGNKVYFYYWDYLLVAAAIVLLARMMAQPGREVHLALLSLVVGIAFLVKPTAFILVVLLTAVYAIDRLWAAGRSMRWSERFLLAAPFLIGPLAYLFYNPSLLGLYEYVKGGLEISSGFAAAMSLDTGPHDASILTGTCLVIGFAVAVAVWRRSVPIAGALMVLVAAWVSFRHGFVRSDSSHVADFFAFSILVFGFFLALLKQGALRGAYLLGFATFSFVALTGVADRWSPLATAWWTPAINLTNARDLMHWSKEMSALDHAADALFRTQPIASFAAQVRGSNVLMFPWDISAAARQPVNIVPLYVLQAYSAHTRYLDQASATRLRSVALTIDHVVLGWSDIDGRNALMDVPATWMALFSGFVPQDQTADSLLLRRRPQPLVIAYQPLAQEPYHPEQWVSVPPSDSPVAMSVDLRPTAFGSLLLGAYKIPAIAMQVRTLSGSIQSFRVTADVLASPSFINCLPLSFASLAELWSANLAKDPIVALRLTGTGLEHMRGGPYRFFDVRGASVIVTGKP